MNLGFLLELGNLRIDCAIAKSIGELDRAEELLIDAYFLVHKQAFFDGYPNCFFDVETFLLNYPEYDADYYHYYYLGRDKRNNLEG